MKRITKTFRLWAMLASIFTVFNVAGLSASAVQASDDDAMPCADCLDDATTGPTIDLRRKHSDLV